MKKALVFGATNPSPTKKKGTKQMATKKGASKKKAQGKKKGSSKGHKKGPKKKGSRNPGMLKSLDKSPIGKVLKHGLAFAAGAIASKAVGQNVVPTSVRTGSWAPLASAGVGLGLGLALNQFKATRDYALTVGAGGVGIAGFEFVAPKILPSLAFNVLGELSYLGEIDSRTVLTLGEIDPRRVASLARSGLGEAPQVALQTVHNPNSIVASGLPA